MFNNKSHETENNNCYCHVRNDSTEKLEKNKTPRGYCNLCDICGSPGHLQHAPGCHPYTAAWCNKCLRAQTIINNIQCLSLPVFVGGLMFLQGYVIIISFFLFIGAFLVNSYGKNIIRFLART